MDPTRELLQLCDTNSWKRGTRSEPVAGITLVHLESLIQVKSIEKRWKNDIKSKAKVENTSLSILCSYLLETRKRCC